MFSVQLLSWKWKSLHIKLTTHLHLLPSLRSGGVPLLPYTPSCSERTLGVKQLHPLTEMQPPVGLHLANTGESTVSLINISHHLFIF
jgi:hypothetical protein